MSFFFASLSFILPWQALLVWGALCVLCVLFTYKIGIYIIKWQILDVPNARSHHQHVTPTSGGLAIFGGISFMAIAFMVLLVVMPSLFSPAIFSKNTPFALTGFFGIFGLYTITAILGLCDDIRPLPVIGKLVSLLLIASSLVYILGAPQAISLSFNSYTSFVWIFPTWFALFLALFWGLLSMNSVNFMDGANGLMGSVMAIAFFGFFVISLLTNAPYSALLASSMGAGILGFLPHNAQREARLFCGDVGALSLGFMYAALSLLWMKETSLPVFHAIYIAPLLILPFLGDVGLTLCRRLMQKKTLWNAHNEHLYQKLIQAGLSHKNVTHLYSAFSILMAVLLSLVLYSSFLPLSLFFLLSTVFCISLYTRGVVWCKARSPEN